MKQVTQNRVSSIQHLASPFVTRVISLLVAESFLLTSILPVWALETTHLRPTDARDGGIGKDISRELKTEAVRDGGEEIDHRPETIDQKFTTARDGDVRSAKDGAKKVLSFEEIVERIETDPNVATSKNLQVVLEKLSDTHWAVRQAALQTIPSFQVNPSSFSEANLNLVIEKLSDTDEYVRQAALQTIPSFIQADPQHATEVTLNLVLEKLSDPDEYVRWRALQTIPSFQVNPSSFSEANLKSVLEKLSDTDRGVRWAALDRVLTNIHPALSESFFKEIKTSLPKEAQTLDLVALSKVNQFFWKLSLQDLFLGDQSFVKAYLYRAFKEGENPEVIETRLREFILPSLRILEELLNKGNPTFGAEIHQISDTPEKRAFMSSVRPLFRYFDIVQKTHQVARTEFEEKTLETRLLPTHLVGLRILLQELTSSGLIQISPYTFTIGESLGKEGIVLLSSNFFFPTGVEGEIPFAPSTPGSTHELGFPGILFYTGATVDAKAGGETIGTQQTNIYARILGKGYEKELWRLGIFSMATSQYLKDPEGVVGKAYQELKTSLRNFYHQYLTLDPTTTHLLLGEGYDIPQGDSKVDESKLHNALTTLQNRLNKEKEAEQYLQGLIGRQLETLEKALFPDPFILHLIKTAYSGDLEGMLATLKNEAGGQNSPNQALSQELLEAAGLRAADGGAKAARLRSASARQARDGGIKGKTRSLVLEALKRSPGQYRTGQEIYEQENLGVESSVIYVYLRELEEIPEWGVVRRKREREDRRRGWNKEYEYAYVGSRESGPSVERSLVGVFNFLYRTWHPNTVMPGDRGLKDPIGFGWEVEDTFKGRSVKLKWIEISRDLMRVENPAPKILKAVIKKALQDQILLGHRKQFPIIPLRIQYRRWEAANQRTTPPIRPEAARVERMKGLLTQLREKKIENENQKKQILEALNILNDEERTVILHRHELLGRALMNYRALGKRVGVSRQWAYEMERKALLKLERHLNSPEITEASPVADLSLGKRANLALKFANIQTVGELIQKREWELLRYKYMGRATLREIKEVLAQRGFSLAGESPVRPPEAARLRSASARQARDGGEETDYRPQTTDPRPETTGKGTEQTLLDPNASILTHAGNISLFTQRSLPLFVNGDVLINEVTHRGFEIAVRALYVKGMRTPQIYLVGDPFSDRLWVLQDLYSPLIEVIDFETYQRMKRALGDQLAEVGFDPKEKPKEGHILSGIGLLKEGLLKDSGIRKDLSPELLTTLETLAATQLHLPETPTLRQDLLKLYDSMV